MPKKVKDPQAGAVYAAEDTVPSQEFGSLEEFDDFLTDVIETKWFGARWPTLMGLNTYDGRGVADACGRSVKYGNILVGEITAPVRSRNALHGLHELAHVCDVSDPLTHDEVFVGIELALVGFALGRRTRDKLRDAFMEHGVAWRQYRHG